MLFHAPQIVRRVDAEGFDLVDAGKCDDAMAALHGPGKNGRKLRSPVAAERPSRPKRGNMLK